MSFKPRSQAEGNLAAPKLAEGKAVCGKDASLGSADTALINGNGAVEGHTSYSIGQAKGARITIWAPLP